MEKDNLQVMRHSCSHLLASAVMELWPETKLAIGPAIEEGFYYDFDLPQPISDADLSKIEAKMAEIKEKNLNFIKKDVSIEEAKKLFAGQQYKLELIDEKAKAKGVNVLHPKGVKLTKTEEGGVYLVHSGGVQGEMQLSTYYTGSFIDLCIGPHVKNTSQIGAFKLLSLAGAYWKGSEKNKMLTRIYGTCFPTQKELDDYLSFLEETKKRDHRLLGKELDLFSVDEYIGPGLILWHPKLSIVREEIELYWRKQHRKKGYQYVYTPHVGLDNLWKTSGHLEFFKDGMYPPMAMETKNKEEKATYYAKPMNCPFHVRIYKSRPRSYRELPIRWCELGSVYRYEESGVLHGMLRVRGFTQDDAHIICREDQFIEEVNAVLDFALELNKDFGFDQLNVYFSSRDLKNKGKYVGEERVWNLSEKALKEILEKRNIKFHEDVGGAKFYGPSIDLKAVDILGREWQGTTIQLDMNLPTKFGMTYIGKDGKEYTPVMLHRTLLGSMERFVGTLIEHYAGAFPVWLSPIQAKIIPVSEKSLEYSQSVAEKLKAGDIRVEVDDRNQRMQAKIRDAEKEKIPYMLIVGPKESQEDRVSARVRGENDLGSMKVEEFLRLIKEDIAKKRQV